MLSAIDETLVRHVARLSRLTMDDSQIARMADAMTVIVGYFDQLALVDTTGVPMTSCATSIENVFRDDEVRGSLSLEVAFANAPQRQVDSFRVPKIIGADSVA